MATHNNSYDRKAKIRTITRIIEEEPLFDRDGLELAKWMSRSYFCSLGESLSAIAPRSTTAKKASADSDDEIAPDNERHSESGYIRRSSISSRLTSSQSESLKHLKNARSGLFYLYGKPGSGKTEVFLQFARHILGDNRGVIYLVPEIALTYPVADMFSERFSFPFAVLHSGLSPARRLREWRRIQQGTAQIVIGTRSAIFAPIRNLGAIIIDEEHESAYKSDRKPRYHARHIAQKRRANRPIPILFGSATPSVEAWKLMHSGALRRLDLHGYPAGGAAASISIVDMTRVKNDLLSPQLAKRIREVKNRSRQSLLLLNRRGFANCLNCKSCGYTMQCDNCAVAMTYHKSIDRMICHYCDYSTMLPEICPECSSLDLRYSFPGTEQLDEEIAMRFPDISFRRLDADIARKRDASSETLRLFRNGELDLLMGTQMIAKGLNFPKLQLVGVIQADAGLLLPDFRAPERLFALLTQVAGRAGRFFADGEVIIQTYRPKNSAIVHAATDNAEEFYTKELDVRKMLSFPPYTRLIRIVFRSGNNDRAYETARRFAKEVKQSIERHSKLAGPVECPIGLIAGKHRYQILIRTLKFDETHAILYRAARRFTLPASVYLEVDINPMSML